MTEWTRSVLELPGAPAIWVRAAEGKGLIKVDTDEGLYGIASDGTWWEPTGRSDRPWNLAMDHPATEGVLLALLGAGAAFGECRLMPFSSSGGGVTAWKFPKGGAWLSLGLAAIEAAEAGGGYDQQ